MLNKSNKKKYIESAIRVHACRLYATGPKVYEKVAYTICTVVASHILIELTAIKLTFLSLVQLLSTIGRKNGIK